ncbi:hypothetical protein BDY17DRAFT_325744 [Neohortaea acidophila]|uniref:RING-type E3 ubiquitin transferase n=1 Tax=Neohortaea acidophila TaxID=245834 RepID=A0A6A6PLR6_9PEZI|nr:uncharacterized protein BDY17DRAFT_325744 [Neohortaea acidophila]KAF2481020.1 hypothetical protein BDY17DRAFT_325744 [Neohortaea acidophila]
MTRVESNVDDGCIVCSNPIDHASLTPCNHRYCTICSLRMRALYKTKACAICRTEAPLVIFTDEKERKFVEFNVGEFYRTDENMGIAYEQQAIFEDTVVLLRYNCPDPSCDVACLGWPDLHRHVRSAHQKQMCDLCARNKKVFTHEHELFTQQELRKHEKYGDDNPGAVDQSGFQGHPECGFCRKRFYGEDELYVHCRDSHERCHLCDRRTGGRNPQYYLDYNALEQHFGKDHFPCLDNECLEKKFVVFDSEMDLKAHQLENHPNGLSKDARRDARRVDLSSFDYRPQYQEIRRGGRRGGRGRDPNSDAIPATSGAHMSRAELVHQRQREIQSAQSTTPRTFGGQLTASEPHVQSAQRPANAAQSPQIRNAQPAFPALNEQPNTNGSSTPRPAPALTPAEQARQLRHNAVTERAAHLLSNDEARLAEFRSRISSYRNGTISASDLIDAFFSLFDTSSAELGKLIKELADIFEITTKRDALLKAWNDWKAINEDYPSLPGPSGPTSAAGALGSGMSGSRVLRLKSATAPSARSTMGQQRSWGATAASANNPFPVLPASNNKGTATPAPTPSWLALRPASSSRPISAKVSPAPSRSQSSANLGRTDAFPALPAAAKPTSTVFTPGYTGAGVIRQSVGSGVNAWAGSAGGGGGANGGASSVPAAAGDADVGKGKGRKGKNVVFKWG